MKTYIVDKISNKIYKAKISSEKLCLTTIQEELLYLVPGKCYVMSPNRYSEVMRNMRVGLGGLFAEGYVMPDTIRIIAWYLALYNPKGATVYEVTYDIREDKYGISIDNRYLPLKYEPSALKCQERFCAAVGTIVVVEDTAKLVTLDEGDYRRWLADVMTQKPNVRSWDFVERQITVYENLIREIVQELTKVADAGISQYINHIVSRYRELQSLVTQPKEAAPPPPPPR